jgi:hypothetical protein
VNSSNLPAADAARLRTASDVIARSLGQSSVLIRLSTNRIYELNVTGARIWELLAKGATRDEIIEALQQEFDADRIGISEAVDALLQTLRVEGLI